jgi:hypothetical protein
LFSSKRGSIAPDPLDATRRPKKSLFGGLMGVNTQILKVELTTWFLVAELQSPQKSRQGTLLRSL